MPQIWVSSFSRAGGTDSQFWVNTNSIQGLGAPGQTKFRRLRPVSAIVCWTAYNVDATDNTLVVVEQAGAKSVTASVTPGNYDLPTICTAVATALTAASAQTGNAYTYTVSYSTATALVTITSTGAFSIQPPVAGRLYGLNQLLGFSMSSPSNAYATSQVGPRVASAQRYPFAYLKCSAVTGASSWVAGFSNDQLSPQQGQLTGVFATVPTAAAPFGSYVTWQNTTIEWHMLSNDPTLHHLEFSITDENGTPIVLNGQWWAVQLEVD